MNELIVLRERSRIEASDYRTELHTLMAATPQPTPAQYPQLEHIMHQLLLRLDREARFSRTLVQGCGSGSAWIRIHFPSWIQEDKFVN